MHSHLTEIGQLSKTHSLYMCDCGNTVQANRSQVNIGRKVSCGCATRKNGINQGLNDHKLYNVFYAHKFNKKWESFFEFLAELGTPPYENAWVRSKVAGTEIGPGNVCWGEQYDLLTTHPEHRIDMHHQQFASDDVLKQAEKDLYVLTEQDPNSWTHGLEMIQKAMREQRHEDLETWQKNIENYSTLYSIETRKESERKVMESGRASQTQVARLFRYQLCNALAELLEEWHQKSMSSPGRAGRHRKVVQPILNRGIDCLTVAHICITVVLDSMGRGIAFQTPITKIKQTIGERIDHQAFLNTVETYYPKEFDKITRWYLKSGEMGYVYKINNAKRSVPDLNYNFLGAIDQVHLGDWAFEAFAALTKWFDAEEVLNVSIKKSKRNIGHTKYLKLSEEGIKHREMLQAIADEAEYEAWPMVYPPLDWTPEERGGYILTHPGNYGDLIHNDKGTLPSAAAFDAINKQQRQAFTINKYIYDVQRSLLGTAQDIGAFKAYEAESWVDQNMPRFDPEIWERPSDDPERRAAKRKLKKAYGEQKRAEKLAKNPYRVLKTAARFYEVDRFYFSCFFDSRLRIYTHASTLTYQGSDYQKALLMFADGYEVTPANSEQVRKEMLVSLANTWGNDKISFAERVEFAEGLVKDLEYVAKDPLTTQAKVVWAEGADEPFQFLALLREYYELFVWKTKTVAQVPGGRDATNSGNQILGGMCRDAKTCYYTNVITEFRGLKADKPQDLYGVVADGAARLLRADVWVAVQLDKYRTQALKKAEKDGTEPPPLDAFIQTFDPGKLNRKHLKRAVMIDAYGGSWQSKNEHISAELTETAKAADSKVTLADKRLVTDAAIIAQANEFPLSTDLNKWFKELGKAAVKAGLELVHWQTPDGSHIVQEYRVPNLVQVTTYAMGGGTYPTPMRGNRSQPVVQDGYTNEIMEGKTATALGANFTHSHDSMIIRGCMNELHTPFFGVHDCLYAPHGTLQHACKLMRLSYYQTVSGHALERLIESNGLQGQVIDPPRGDADITSCVDSPYMFS